MSKKNIILGQILVVLIALAYLYQGPIGKWRADRNRSDNFLSSVKVAEVTAFEITRGGDTVVLIKEGNKWKIGGTKSFYAPDNVMTGVINAVDRATQAGIGLVGKNQDRKSEFQTDDSGIYVVFKQGERVLGDVIIGKLAGDFQSTYVSQPGIASTYELSENIHTPFAQDDWYDKTIFSSDRNAVVKVRFQYPTREFTIEKQGTSTDAEWEGTLPYDFSIDEENIDGILDIMSNLTAAEIPEQTFEGTGLEGHGIIVQATGEGIDNVLMVGGARAEDDEDADSLYYVKRGDSDNIYLITQQQRDELDKQIPDLK